MSNERAIFLLRKLVEGWKSIPEDTLVPDEINDGRFEEAEEFLRNLESAQKKAKKKSLTIGRGRWSTS